MRIGLDCHMPQGAFYAFPSIKRTGLTAEEFAERLLFEEHVAVVPGPAFGQGGAGPHPLLLRHQPGKDSRGPAPHGPLRGQSRCRKKNADG